LNGALWKARLVRLLKRRWCPKCHCIDVEEIVVSVECDGLSDGADKALQKLHVPNRPSESFECCRCRYSWVNPAFERYLVKQNVFLRSSGRVK
jgi:hypothetical protein